MLGFNYLDGAELICQPLGFLHFVPMVTQEYVKRYGVPTAATLGDHYFVDTILYAGGQKIWEPWRDLVNQGTLLHVSDSSLAYGLMVRSGLGIGLLGTYALADRSAFPLPLGVAIRIPMYLYAYRTRLESKAVRVSFEWLMDVFGSHNEVFAENLNLAAAPRSDFSWTVSRLFD